MSPQTTPYPKVTKAARVLRAVFQTYPLSDIQHASPFASVKSDCNTIFHCMTIDLC